MPKEIYLASNSKARRELLKRLGIKFRVLLPVVIEKRRAGKGGYAQLVKDNALAKAQDAAGRIRSGIVIGADTITVQGGRIYGKPKDLESARIMLKRLSSGPQWLYTGLAVIDKGRGKTLVSYEKTKVYMNKMSDEEIFDYFSKVTPLDKAGSFDIQSRGAFFIPRVEGCFYNVVGLPIAKLYQMFKKLRVPLFTLLLCTFFSGCSTEYNIATGEQDVFYYSTDKEVQIGRSIVAQVEREYKLTEDPLIQKRVEDIGKKIEAVCDRKDIDYVFKVLEDDEVNAFSLPGGFIYVNRGLVEKVDNDDQLACVLAHEVAHIVARHSIKKLQAATGFSILKLLVIALPQGQAETATAADLAFLQILLGYGRDDELLSDQLASRYAKAAGYKPRAMIDFLEKLQEINRRKPLQPRSYFKTHPYIPDRIRTVKQELGEGIDFSDYINIEERKK